MLTRRRFWARTRVGSISWGSESEGSGNRFQVSGVRCLVSGNLRWFALGRDQPRSKTKSKLALLAPLEPRSAMTSLGLKMKSLWFSRSPGK